MHAEESSRASQADMFDCSSNNVSPSTAPLLGFILSALEQEGHDESSIIADGIF